MLIPFWNSSYRKAVGELDRVLGNAKKMDRGCRIGPSWRRYLALPDSIPQCVGLGLVQTGKGMASEALTMNTFGKEIKEVRLSSSQLFVARG